jgi:hypothetical protein
MAELFVGGYLDPGRPTDKGHERTGDRVTLRTEDFTTHGVIVGMTGSGKTGLGIVLVEEVLTAGLPALLIDPKGDLTNLCLTFPDLAPASFRPWIDEAQAKAAGQTPDEFAAAQAATWKDGLAGWGYGPEQIQALRDTCDFTIYTPGSRAGAPINIVGSLEAPDAGSGTVDAETVADEIEGYVSGLLGLVRIEADPLASREHILLSNLIQHAWAAGQALDLAALVGQVQQPPIDKLGVIELDQFFPKQDRQKLAMQLNGLLASPSFAAWSDGAPLDVQDLLYRADGTPRCAIVTTAHLSDEERQFVTSLLLTKLVTWMRRQSGTTDLRALLYMDEVAGYLPPTAMPPTKKPIMTLMKQARAFGVGVVLATQNPVDVDYKAISNAGTWMVGRLQTERDKDRLLDGMSAAAGGVDIAAVSDTISGLDKREFVLRRAGKDKPDLITSRWAMSYLRGPMTKDQIRQLSGEPPSAGPAESAGGTAATTSAPTEAAATTAADTAASGPAASTTDPTTPPPAPPEGAGTPVMPAVAEGVAVRWAAADAPWLADIGGDGTSTTFEPAIVATVHLRYDESKADLVHDEDYRGVLFPLSDPIDASRVAPVALDDASLATAAPSGATYRFTNVPIDGARTWKQVERALVDHLVRVGSIELRVNRQLKISSTPGESPEAFQTRCAQAAQALIDADRAELATKYSTKQAKLHSQREAAADRAEVVVEQAKERRRGNWLRAAGDVLGSVFGSRRSAAGRIGRAADRLTRNSDGERVDEAQGKIGRIDEQLAALESELAAEQTAIEAKWATAAQTTTTLPVTLERTDVKVAQLALVWIPVP